MRLEWMGETLLLRSVNDGDRGFIYSTWLYSYRATQHAHKGRWRDAYEAGQRRRIDRLWPGVIVACSPEVPVSIHAWVCGKPGRLDYVYVPFELQRKGLARLVVDKVCGPEPEFTHRWPFETVPRGWMFNEYLLEGNP
jgi:hypothetical protein